MIEVLRAERQVLFVTGEVGIGKTSLVDAFCRQYSTDGQARMARGQSVEGFGGKEPYYPVMEALTQLCTESGDGKSLRVLQQKAPNWHAKLPVVMTSEVRPVLASSLPSERLLGEICDALEAMAAETPLILVFEDLHWADHSTLDLISALARRRAQAKLMVIATYRPADISEGQHPLKGLKQDLVTRKLCVEIALRPLSKAAVTEYLVRELEQAKPPSGLSSFLHQHSEGNPLFMIAVLEHLISQNHLRRENDLWQLASSLAEIDLGVPAALSELIELQIERLAPTDQRLLEAASLIGVVFPAWAAAAALNGDLEEIEDQYEKLTRRLHFLNPADMTNFPTARIQRFTSLPTGSIARYCTSANPRRAGPAAIAAWRRSCCNSSPAASRMWRPKSPPTSRPPGDWALAADALMTSAMAYLNRGDQEEALLLMRQAAGLLENLPERERAESIANIHKQISSIDKRRVTALSA